jgi:hypothetical protein
MSLILQPNLVDPDAIYEKLIAMLESQGSETAMRCSARLILLLANHIGDKAVIEEAIDRAAQSQEATP